MDTTTLTETQKSKADLVRFPKQSKSPGEGDIRQKEHLLCVTRSEGKDQIRHERQRLGEAK